MVQLIEPDADDVHNELVSCGKHINVEIPQLHLELLQPVPMLVLRIGTSCNNTRGKLCEGS